MRKQVTHVFFDWVIYAPNFVLFLQRRPEFNLSDHQYVFVGKLTEENVKSINSLGKPPCMIVISTHIGTWRLFRKMWQSKKVIIHGFPLSNLFNLALLLQWPLLSRIYWDIWGGDLYTYRERQHGFLNKLTELQRKLVFRKIRHVIAWVKGDYDLAQSVYEIRARYHYAFYPKLIDPMLIEHVLSLPKTTKTKKLTVIVGNSADPANGHIEIFENLARYSNEDISIISPLSYGSAQYAKKVVDSGVKFFGDRFQPILNILPLDEYINLLGKVDVAIMNYRTQKGLGNSVLLLALGKKLFIRSDTTPYWYFKGLGATLFDTLEIPRLSWDNFISFPKEIADSNFRLILSEYSEEHCASLWRSVFLSAT